jgi:hypothetical protein
MDASFFQPGTVLSSLGSLGLLVAGWFTRKYVLPFLEIGKRRQYASWIATMADDLIDELRSRHPEKKWLDRLDEVVDRLVEICDISVDVAWRAVRAAASRK